MDQWRTDKIQSWRESQCYLISTSILPFPCKPFWVVTLLRFLCFLAGFFFRDIRFFFLFIGLLYFSFSFFSSFWVMYNFMVVHFWGVIYVILFILGINSLDMACTIVEFLDIFAYLTTFKIILFRFKPLGHSTYNKKISFHHKYIWLSTYQNTFIHGKFVHYYFTISFVSVGLILINVLCFQLTICYHYILCNHV